MIEPNQLLQTYIRQYQAASKKKKKDQFPPRDLSERTNRLFKTLKRTKPTQVTSLSLEEWHRQIKKIWLILRTVRTTMLSQSSLKPACCHSSSAWMRQCFCPPSAMIFPWIF